MSEIQFRSPCIDPGGAKVGSLGYSRVWIVGEGRYEYAHRYAYAQAYGEIPKDKVVMHLCDNPPCANVEHLSLGTQSENIRDMYSKGRNKDQRGENGPRSKLTPQQVIAIRESLAEGVTGLTLAGSYKVSPATISEIKHRRRYANV